MICEWLECCLCTCSGADCPIWAVLLLLSGVRVRRITAQTDTASNTLAFCGLSWWRCTFPFELRAQTHERATSEQFEWRVCLTLQRAQIIHELGAGQREMDFDLEWSVDRSAFSLTRLCRKPNETNWRNVNTQRLYGWDCIFSICVHFYMESMVWGGRIQHRLDLDISLLKESKLVLVILFSWKWGVRDSKDDLKCHGWVSVALFYCIFAFYAKSKWPPPFCFVRLFFQWGVPVCQWTCHTPLVEQAEILGCSYVPFVSQLLLRLARVRACVCVCV